jgi:hypothetical protein
MEKSDYYFWAGFTLAFFTPIVAGYLEELYVSMHGYLFDSHGILIFSCNLCVLICGIFLMIVGIIRRNDE